MGITSNRVGIQIDVRPFEGAIAAHVGTQHVFEIEVDEVGHGIPEREPRLFAPAVDGNSGFTALVEAYIECQYDALWPIALEPLFYILDPSHGRAADDYPRHTGLEHSRDRLGVTHAATHLKLDGILPRQANDELPVTTSAVAGTVEVDDVQPIGAQAPVLIEQRARFGRVARLGSEIATQQSYAVPVSQIDGWYQAHDAPTTEALAAAPATPEGTLRKFCSMRAPTAADRSGWNCAPKKLPHCTQAENDTP